GAAVTVRLGAVVPPDVARDAVRALPPLGAGLIEIAPVGPADVPAVCEAAVGRRVPVVIRAEGPDAPEVVEALSPHVDAVRTGPDSCAVQATSVADAAAALADTESVVLATPAVLKQAGPGWFTRVAEAATHTHPPAAGLGEVGRDPRRWPAWWWGVLVGAGMICAGIGAAAITLGPVLLWYDRDYLGMSTEQLHAANHHLVHFLQHDRITMAGTMVTIGILYVALSAGGMRRGWPWAREAYLVSGWIAFPPLFYFLGFGFLEPLHTAVTLVLFPVFLLATRRKGVGRPRWTLLPEGPERERRRALAGQLLLVFTGSGIFIGGAAVSVVGLTSVFVPPDLVFLHTGPEALHTANPRLMSFIAHDRAGLGGALMATAGAVVLLTAWGWRRGESWVWWTLLLCAVTGFLPAIVVHGAIGYTDFLHLAPVYLGVLLTGTALALGRAYLCAPRAVR
ncbi:hypothetical protein AN219_07900, partial [Streptomyces nanshensis]